MREGFVSGGGVFFYGFIIPGVQRKTLYPADIRRICRGCIDFRAMSPLCTVW